MIVDSSFLAALLIRRDRSHARVAALERTLRLRPWLPQPAVTEICYMLEGRHGPAAVSTFLASLADGSAGVALLEPEPNDYGRAAEIIAKYADSGLDFVDALIVALAERLNIGTILTLDHRHFSVVRPRHRAAFEVLPGPE